MYHVRACVESIYKYSALPFHLRVIDDCGDVYTKSALRELLECYPVESYSLITNEVSQGYLRNFNKGISSGSNPYVIISNSDTMAIRGCSEKAKSAVEGDSSIGVVSAVSTWTNWTRIPFPNGYTVKRAYDRG